MCEKSYCHVDETKGLYVVYDTSVDMCRDKEVHINLSPATLSISFFIHLHLCLDTSIHNFKWVEITYICLVCDQTFANHGA